MTSVQEHEGNQIQSSCGRIRRCAVSTQSVVEDDTLLLPLIIITYNIHVNVGKCDGVVTIFVMAGLDLLSRPS